MRRKAHEIYRGTQPRRNLPTCRTTLEDISGASIVIALVFFLICAIIGSVVLTAASINAKAVATHQATQQTDNTVSSAARVVANNLTPAIIVWTYDSAEAKAPKEFAYYETPGVKPTGVPLGSMIWKKNLDAIWGARAAGTSFAVGGGTPLAIEVAGNPKELPAVYAWVTFDRDFNIEVRLSKNEKLTATSAYDETVTVQCVPTYDNAGRLLECEWSDPVISKTNATPPASGSGGAS